MKSSFLGKFLVSCTDLIPIKRLKRLCKKRLRKIFSNTLLTNIKTYANAKEWLNENDLEANCHTIHQSESFIINTPRHVEDADWIGRAYGQTPIVLNEVYALELPNANYVPSFSSYVVDNVLMDDISIEFTVTEYLKGLEHSLFVYKMPKEMYFDKNVAILDAIYSNNYFHWFIDILSKLEIFEKSNFEIDYYLVDTSLPFQKRSLEMINFPMEKIIKKEDVKNLKAKNIICSSISSTGSIHANSLNILKKRFANHSNLKEQDRINIFISRKGAKRRKILNEDELIEVLNGYNFIFCNLEEMDFKDQVELFSKAKNIVGPHGAGMTNMMFAPENTKIFEICNPNYMVGCYCGLANMLGFDYYYFLGDGYNPQNTNVYDCSGNIEINIEKFKKLLFHLSK